MSSCSVCSHESWLFKTAWHLSLSPHFSPCDMPAPPHLPPGVEASWGLTRSRCWHRASCTACRTMSQIYLFKNHPLSGISFHQCKNGLAHYSNLPFPYPSGIPLLLSCGPCQISKWKDASHISFRLSLPHAGLRLFTGAYEVLPHLLFLLYFFPTVSALTTS